MNAWQWGIENGLTDGTRPDDPVTRQEAIAMMNRLLNLFADGSMDDEYMEESICDMLPFSLEELDILYRIAWAEARGEDDKGIILVINVILNRKNSPVFPRQNTIKEVVFAPNQFAPVSNGAFDRATPDQRIKDLVYRAIQGEDYSRGALFFNSIRLRHTSWAAKNRQHAFDHGGHSFYF